MRIYLFQTTGIKTKSGHSIEQVLQTFGAHKVERDEDGSLDFDRIEAVIINGNDDITAASYVIAVAIAKQKPVLFLLEKGSSIPDSIKDFRADKKMSMLFHLAFATPEKLTKTIGDFIQKAEGGVKEYPSIKFTLRITPSMERYLQWKSKRSGISKADFLRNELAQISQKDPDFKS